MFVTNEYDSVTTTRHDYGEFMSEENTSMAIVTWSESYYAFFAYHASGQFEAQTFVTHWQDDPNAIPLTVFAIAY